MATISHAIEILNIMIWPVVVILGVALLISKRGSTALARVLGPMRRLKAFGVELDLGPEEGRRIKASLEETFREYREDVESEFDRQAERYDVARLCAQVAEEVIEPCLKPSPSTPIATYRCTVYVLDIVFKDVLYRLLDYYPRGNGKGSIYSTRFGIIGRSWRLSEPLYERTVPGDQGTLITQWGMTRREAAGQDEKSFVTFLLRDDEHKPPVGLLYVEASHDGFATDLRPKLAAAPSIRALTDAVTEVMREMRGRGPMLELFKS